ncbi:MAG: hypothetical protein AB1348_07705, partial [Nitrospirota bacterium]
MEKENSISTKLGMGFSRLYQRLTSTQSQVHTGPYLIEIKQGEQKKRRRIKVNKARFPMQRLTLPEGMVFLSPEDEYRANREAERASLIWS